MDCVDGFLDCCRIISFLLWLKACECIYDQFSNVTNICMYSFQSTIFAIMSKKKEIFGTESFRLKCFRFKKSHIAVLQNTFYQLILNDGENDQNGFPFV